MKTKIIFFSIFLQLLLSLNVISQVSREWLSTYNFTSEDAKDLVVDTSGNVYVTGSSSGDYATVKYNSYGVQQWVARYNGPGNSGDGASAIAIDNSGNVYVTGGSNGISSGSDYATIKYSPSGTELWAVRHSGPGNNLDVANAIAVDGAGNVYVTGFFYGGSTSWDYSTVKYNTAGVFQWAKGYNGTGNFSDFASAIAIDGSGNAYVTGYSRGSGTSDDDFATVKYSSSGVEQWVSIYQGPGDGFDQAQSIAVDGSNNVYVTGRSLGDGTQYDYASIKYNSSGDSLWVRRYNGTENSTDNARAITVDPAGNVYVFGQSYSSVSDYDFATVKYNSSGDFQWDKRFNGPGNSVENANSMTLDNLGNVYVTGSSAVPGQNYNYATVKYSSSGAELWSDTYNGTAGGSDEPFSIVADASGNVYVTGGSAGLNQMKDYVTIKYSQNPYAAITAFVEGFYNSSLNKLTSDTVKVYLRSVIVPYILIDSSKSKLDSTGKGRFYFPNISNGTNYYVVLKHRNSIETWSIGGNAFSSGILTYDFTPAANKAYGNNQVHVDNSPVGFAIYSGDVNQDGNIEGLDLGLADNDAFNFVTGYVNTDVNGNNVVDASDLTIIDNNAFNFVSKITPP